MTKTPIFEHTKPTLGYEILGVCSLQSYEFFPSFGVAWPGQFWEDNPKSPNPCSFIAASLHTHTSEPLVFGGLKKENALCLHHLPSGTPTTKIPVISSNTVFTNNNYSS